MAERSSLVRLLVAGTVGLVVGLALAGLAPRSELRSLQAEVDELSKEQKCSNSGIGRDIASAFRGRPMEAALEQEEVDAIDRSREPEPDEDGVNIEFTIGSGDEEERPERLDEGLQMAKDAMALRQAQARAALDEDLAPSEEQWEQLDDTLDRMNEDLKSLADEFVGNIADGQEPSRREAMIFAADTLDVLLEADDAIWGSLTEEQRAMADEEAIDPMAHVDPELLDVFMELDR